MEEPFDIVNVLVPTDGSDAAREAARQAIRFAQKFDATLHVLYAMDMGTLDYVAVPSDIAETRRRLEKKGGEFTAEIEEMAEEAGVACVTAVVSDTPVEAIVEYVAENEIDLVGMGKRGRGDPDKPLLGSTTKRVMGLVDVPVFTA